MKYLFLLLVLLEPLLGISQDTKYLTGENPKEITPDLKKTDTPDKGTVDLSHRMPKAGDQGNKGSCWAWTAAYLLSFAKGAESAYSPEYIYQRYKGNTNDCNHPENSWEILESVFHDGALTLSEFPNVSECNKQPTEVQRKKAEQGRMGGYSVEVLDKKGILNSMKVILSRDQIPLLVSMQVDDYFMKKGNITKDRPYWKEFGYYDGNHAMIIVGYEEGFFKVLNSWGTGFGDNGYVWISNSILEEKINYVCYAKKTMENSAPPGSTVAKNQPDEDQNTNWVKEGYYREFEGFRIVMVKLDTKKGFAIVEIRGTDNSVKNSFYLDVKDTRYFELGGERYSFTFNNIGTAGKIRWPLAAYYTIEKL